MTILPQEGTFASALGSAMGRGISEQGLKELERFRLRSGLEQVQKQAEGGQTSHERLISNMMTIPGMTPEMFNVLYPLARAKMESLEAQRALGARQQGAAMPQAQITPGAPAPGMAQPVVTGEVIETPESVKQLAFQMHQQQPLRYRTPAEAEPEARQQIHERNALVNTAKEQLENALMTQLQVSSREDLYKQTEGVFLNDLSNKMANDIRLGKKTVQQAATEYAQRARDLAQAKTAIKTVPGLLGNVIGGPSYETQARQIEKIRDVYKDNNLLEQFRDEMVAALEISPNEASRIAYPLAKEGIKAALQKKPSPQEAARKVAPLIKDDDSLLTLADEYARNFADYSRKSKAEKFLNELGKLEKEKKAALSDQQKKELRQGVGFTLKGMYLKNLGKI